METTKPAGGLVYGFFTALILSLFVGCGPKTEGPASGDDIKALREEVTALREEVAQLRSGRSVGGRSGASTSRVNPEDPAAVSMSENPAEILEQLKALRAQMTAAQSEISSNMTQIAVDRGSDAWSRGDFKTARRLLQAPADGGNPVAQHRMGVMSVLGQGTEKDKAEAIKWFSKAAVQGQGESQHSLGLRLLWGDGTDKDPAAAAAWFTAAANQGIPDSATWLGDIYFEGNGVQADPIEGYKWLLLAGDKFGINHRGDVTLDTYAARLTPEQKAEAERRAKAFSPKRIGPEDP